MSSEAKNLAAIQAAIDQHAERCSNPPLEIHMAPYEVERLGWDEYRGLPIVGDPEMQTGRVRIVCAGESEPVEAAAAREEIAVAS